MAGVERLKEVEGLAAPDFTDEDPVRAEPERSLEQFPNGDARKARLFAASLQPDHVVLSHLNFRSVLDDDDALLGADELGKNIEQGGFAGPGSARDQDILAKLNRCFELKQQFRRQCTYAD